MRELKIWRHDADDGGGFAVDPDRLADNVRIAVEIAFPDFVPEDRHFLSSRLVVLGGEIAAENRLYVDDLEKILGHIAAGVALRSFLVGDVDGRAVEIGAHHRERLLTRAQVFVILRRWDVAVAEVIILIRGLRIDEADAHELLGMRKGKAAQHDCVHHRELGRDAANAEREDDDGEDKKRFVLYQHAKTDAEILKE